MGNNEFAVLARRLRVTAPKAYFTAVKALAPGAEDQFRKKQRDDFFPASFDVLVPFLIPSLQAKEKSLEGRAYTLLCDFDDPKVVDAVVARYLAKKELDENRFTIEQCFNRYAKRSRIQGAALAKVKAALLSQINSELALTQSAPRWVPGPPRSNERHPNERIIAQNLRSLKAFGDLSGFEALDAHFKTSAFPPDDDSLIEVLGRDFGQENAILPAMTGTLERGSGSTLGRACQYFDMRWSYMPRRYDVEYALDIAKAVRRYKVKYPTQSFDKYPLSTCAAAFQSQLHGDGIEAAFESASSRLTPDEKTLADQMRSIKVKEE